MVNIVKKSKPPIRNLSIVNLMRYRLPLSGKVSIMHRISGLILFMSLPLVFYLFELSVTSNNNFYAMKQFFSLPIIKLIVLGISWAYFFHFCAGCRFLLLDIHWLLDKDSARRSSAAVLIISTAITLGIALKLFGVF